MHHAPLLRILTSRPAASSGATRNAVPRPRRIALLLVAPFLISCGDQVPGGLAPTQPSLDRVHSGTRYVSPSGSDAGTCASSPCRTIGYAVVQASPGDIVSVAAGTYHESVNVTRRVSLVGHDATIDAAGLTATPNGVVISGAEAAGSRLSGFTIQHAGLEGVLIVKTSNIVVEHNTVINNDAFGEHDPACEGRPDDCGEALHLLSVTHSVVRDNLVRDNIGGILLTDENGPTFGNLIAENRVLHNSKDCGITLASHHFSVTEAAPASVAGVYRNLVLHNVSNDNGAAGIGVFAGPPGAAAWENSVIGNTAMRNGFAGVMIHSHTPGQYVNDNVVADNTLAGNGIDDDNPFDDAPTGISVFSKVVPIQRTVIAANRISDEHYGIVTAKATSLIGLRTNKFASSVAVPVSMH